MTGEAQPDFFSLYGLQSRGALPAVSDRNGTWTGDETYRKATAVAGWLEANAVEKQAVMLELDSGRDWLATAAGVLKFGGQLVPVNSRWPASIREELLLEGLHLTAGLVEEIELGGASTEATSGLDGRAKGGGSLVLFTSGSTGEPKRIVHGPESIWAQAVLGAEAVGLTKSSHWLVPMPMVHAGGVGAVVRCLGASAAMTLLPDFRADECRRLLEDVSSANPVTHVSLVPTMLRRLIEAGLSNPIHLQAAIIGGAPLADDLKQAALERGIPVRESWGMTETLGLISVCRTAGDSGAGRTLEEVSVRVGKRSELQVKGPITSLAQREGDGWFDTGDLGSIVDGCVHVTGRLGTVIITGGENVSPERVEGALLSLQGIADAYVFGVPDAEWGERIEAQIVGQAGATVTISDVRRELSAILSPWEVPKSIILVEAIGRNELGKIRRAKNG